MADTLTACEYGDVPCPSALREPWCRPCLLDLARQQNDLNERLNAENERLRASYGWLDERFPALKAEVERLRDGIRRHRENVGSYNGDDEDLWALLDDRTENHDG